MIELTDRHRPVLLTEESDAPLVPLVVVLYLLPTLHPLLRPMVGPPSHLLWWIHVLPVAVLAYRHGNWGLAGAMAASVLLAGLGERAFGAGYAIPASWETTWSIAIALTFTNSLVGAFSLYARRSRQWLVHNAFHDSLTGLANRALILDRLERLVERVRRRPEETGFAALYLDLDRFKVVNDSLGHSKGDELLIRIAERMEDSLRGADSIGRIGGDEFVVLLEGVSRPAEVVRVADRIHDLLERPVRLGEHETFVTASIGIATSDTSYEDPEDVLRDADIAMYRAKARERGGVEVFDEEMHARVSHLMALQTDLRHAVERREFEVVYQPIVDLSDRELRAFEGLVRWQHPERGLLPPADFLEAAEDTGLIVPMGYQVLEEASRQLAEWRERFPDRGDLAVSVNLSAGQLTRSDLTDRLEGILRETGLPRDALELEVTESEMMTAVQEGADVMEELKDIGFRIAVDDFGTGYSSLAYLHAFPVDTLKVDRSFVEAVQDSSGRRKIIEAIVRMADSLGLVTVGEGIETEVQEERLRALGCHRGQGYLYARPLAPTDAERLLREQ